MFCKNCGCKLNDGDTVCSVCGSPVNVKQEDVEAVSTKIELPSENKAVVKHKKRRIKLNSCFDDTHPRTSIETALSNKYFFMTICTFLLIIFWLMKTIKIFIPEIDGILMGKLAISLNDIFSGGTVIFNAIKNTGLLSELPEVEFLLTVIGGLYKFATILVAITPIFVILPLLQRSVTKRLWVILTRICLIISFVIHMNYFLVIKIAVALLASEANSKLKVGFNFAGFIFLFLYITAFVLLHFISRDLRKNRRYVQLSQATAEECEQS